MVDDVVDDAASTGTLRSCPLLRDDEDLLVRRADHFGRHLLAGLALLLLHRELRPATVPRCIKRSSHLVE